MIPNSVIRKKVDELVNKKHHLDNKHTKKFAIMQIMELIREVESIGGRIIWLEE